MSLSPLESVSSQLLGWILSFVSSNASDFSAITCCSRTLSRRLGDRSDTPGEDDTVWRVICQSVFRISEERFNQWPNVNSWYQLHRLLEVWVPREGFYVCRNASPWGLLFAFKFEGGEFVGNLLFPSFPNDRRPVGPTGGGGGAREPLDSNNPDHYEVYPVLKIGFDQRGSPSGRLCIGAFENLTVNVRMLSTATTIDTLNMPQMFRRSHSSTPTGASVRAMVLDFGLRDGNAAQVDAFVHQQNWSFDATRRYWHPNLECMEAWCPDRFVGTPNLGEGPSLLRALVHALVFAQRREDISDFRPLPLVLEWVDGPSRGDKMTHHRGMPILRPGLYSGAYASEYGKFQRECVLLEHKVYVFPHRPKPRVLAANIGGGGCEEVKGTQGDSPDRDPDTDPKDREWEGQGVREYEHIWKKIYKDIFRGSSQADPEGIFRRWRREIAIQHPDQVVFVIGRKVTGDRHVPAATVRGPRDRCELTFSPFVVKTDVRVAIAGPRCRFVRLNTPASQANTL